MIENEIKVSIQETTCEHCGDPCKSDTIIRDDKSFCCQGCSIVYTMLHDNGMGDYYNLAVQPGINKKSDAILNFDFLEDQKVLEKLLKFRDNHIAIVSLNLPQIHCSACVWLLENLHKIDQGIMQTRVDFLKQTATIKYNEEATSLKQIAILLTKIGYEPAFTLEGNESEGKKKVDKAPLYKLGVAGFAFGNIMLLSFPEYLGFTGAAKVFWLGYINILLAIPVLFYAGKDYLVSAWKSLKNGQLNLDVPVAIGMITLFVRSVIEILYLNGEGYLDSLAGFVFFLLIGKWYQTFTYHSISFDRNYTSYFPINATLKKDNNWVPVRLDQAQAGDTVLVKNQEIIPGDGVLINGKASLDYSFVSGEADLISKKIGDKVFAGGKQVGGNIEIALSKNIAQSDLVKLWENDIFRKDDNDFFKGVINKVSKYFTINVLWIAAATLLYWLNRDTLMAFETFTAVLIVACPCALALAVPFTYGNILRILSAKHFYIKNVHTIEKIQSATHIIFDKTGTLTDTKNILVTYKGKQLDTKTLELISGTCLQSNHPLSKAIYEHLNIKTNMAANYFEEYVGKGIEAHFGEDTIRMGSPEFILGAKSENLSTVVLLEINEAYQGSFTFEQPFRLGMEEVIKQIATDYQVTILSGDNEKDKKRLTDIFGKSIHLEFNKSPSDKLTFVKNLQNQGQKVMMIGDGLNDAGALKQSDAGIVIADEGNNFSPACEGVLAASEFKNLMKYITYLSNAKYLIYGAMILAVAYNFTGLFFAVSGQLSPVIAAVLMPLSSITVIVYGLLSSKLASLKILD